MRLELHPQQSKAFRSPATEILYGGAAGGGKALALDTPIPTPTGWSTMGDLAIGDEVFDDFGAVCRVIAATERMTERPCYRLIFSDGSEFIADAGHQWVTMTIDERANALRRDPDWKRQRRARRASRGNGSKAWLSDLNRARAATAVCLAPSTGSVRTTAEIARTIATTRTNHSVAVAGALVLPDIDLPVDPYVLGAWLGDGTSSQAAITGADPEIIERIRSAGYVVTKRTAQYAWGILGLLDGLRTCGVLMNKHIPPAYLRAGFDQRLALLQGLMDTDGYCKPTGGCEFTSTSERLRDGALELLATLGIRATSTTGRATLHGVDCGPKYRVKFTTTLPAFALPRKRSRQRNVLRTSHRMIVSADRVESVPVRCIEVDSPSHQFLAGRAMIPTHNSHLARAFGIAACIAVPGLQVGLVRREFGDLKGNHFQGRTSLPMMLAPLIVAGQCKYNVSDMAFTFANGSRMAGHHFQRESDFLGFQGQEWDLLLVEELTHFSEFQYRYLRSRLRSAGLVIPAGITWTFPRILASANPGGPGHTWVRQAFIDPQPAYQIWEAPQDEGGMKRQFIPAKLADNPSIDPKEYTGKLAGLGNPTLVKAMLDGDWDIVAGGMFDDVWDVKRHAIPAFPIPRTWRVDRSFDWGSSKPFSIGWWAEADGNDVKLPDRTLRFPKGTLLRVAEWYGWNGKANEGCRMLASEIARGVLERERAMQAAGGILHGCTVSPGPADSAIYATENGVCIADDMAVVGCRWTPASKGPGSRINGWERCRRMLAAAKVFPMEERGLMVFDTCRQFLRTVPVLSRDPSKSDDIDTDAEDHIADEVRYRVQEVKREAGTYALQ